MAEGKQILKYGCLGCLGLVGLGVVLTAGCFGLAYIGVQREEIERPTIVPELPVPLSVAPGDVEPGERGVPMDTPVAPGQLRIQVHDSGFEIEPARPGQRLQVEAVYDKQNGKLEESLTENPDGTWTYEIRFAGGGGSMLGGLRQLFGGVQPMLTVRIPPELRVSLEIDAKRAGGEIELGGLSLVAADIEMSMAGGALMFSEPTLVPLERLSVHSSMAGMGMERLGNASPRELELEISMGGFGIDLRGEWRNDSEIRIRSSMGGVGVSLPRRGVRIEGVPGHLGTSPAEDEVPPPTLRFQVTGEVQFD